MRISNNNMQQPNFEGMLKTAKTNNMRGIILKTCRACKIKDVADVAGVFETATDIMIYTSKHNPAFLPAPDFEKTLVRELSKDFMKQPYIYWNKPELTQDEINKFVEIPWHAKENGDSANTLGAIKMRTSADIKKLIDSIQQKFSKTPQLQLTKDRKEINLIFENIKVRNHIFIYLADLTKRMQKPLDYIFFSPVLSDDSVKLFTDFQVYN